MSRDLHVSAIDLARFRAVCGSEDEDLLASVLERTADHLARHDDFFRGFGGPAVYVPLAEALAQIIRGRMDPTLTPTFQFEHAVGLLADTLGEPLDAELFMEAAQEFWDEVDTVIRRQSVEAGQGETVWPGLEAVLKRGPYLPVPLDPVWPLGSGFLTAEEVGAAAEAAEACQLDSSQALDDLRWPDDAVDAADQYRDWLRYAASRSVGLFFHA
jgi:hypothetical protein